MARRRPPKLSGLLLVDKPAGLTSHDVVQVARRTLGERRIGHTGTLDPMATGLLVLAVGHATRFARYVESGEKSYLGTVSLGRATTTFDHEGEVTAEAPVSESVMDGLSAVLRSLTGEIEQVVPAYSAIKVDGERLYKKARRGEDVQPPSRRIRIDCLKALAVRPAEIDIETRVSKGTYIRSLAVQIGDGLGLPAHLSALRRTSVGRFSVEQAVRLEDLSEADLLPSEAAVAHLSRIRVKERAESDVSHGRALRAEQLLALEDETYEAGTVVRLLGDGDRLLALAALEIHPSQWKPEAPVLRYACVLNASDQVH